jgi:hypothetical protein
MWILSNSICIRSQEMDEAGFPPDGHCFSMLLEVMLISRELDALDDMLEHVAVSS